MCDNDTESLTLMHNLKINVSKITHTTIKVFFKFAFWKYFLASSPINLKASFESGRMKSSCSKTDRKAASMSNF